MTKKKGPMTKKIRKLLRKVKLRKWTQRDVPIGLLHDNPVYPPLRLEDDPGQPADGDTPVGSLKELEQAIRASGVLIPVTVTQVGDRYVILDGHRRLRVARTLGLGEVACSVLELELGESVELLFIKVQTQIYEDRPWPWSEVDE